MDQAGIVNLTSQALLLVLYLSLPPIIVAALVGTLVSLLQALTQIQEQTLSFAIKLFAVVVTIFLTASWVGGEILNYTINIFDSIPNLVR
ncbi:MAG: EscS/YscS/HrcS family type III secretion system export apparatus protein [Sulfitobacter sp.]|nr:EscS/YscS/HrcS family type III secretion system export apparatus protein [Sulfitobacter sp.]